jgi:hypothetical protein
MDEQEEPEEPKKTAEEKAEEEKTSEEKTSEGKTSENRSAEKEAEEDAELAHAVSIVTEINRKIDDSYDDKIKRLDDKKKLNIDDNEKEEKEAKISIIKEKLSELRSRISEARRKGKDPFMSDLLLKNINAKLKMAEVTGEKHDYDVVEQIMQDAQKELEETIKEEPVNVKKEIEQRLKEEKQKTSGKAADEE